MHAINMCNFCRHEDEVLVKKITFPTALPKKAYLAFSGGVDSVVLLDILAKRNFDLTLLWVDHHTDWCKVELEFCKKISKEYNIPLVVKEISEGDITKGVENYWSVERNKIFQGMDESVFTGHHLDDSVEWYLMSLEKPESKVIHFRNNNVLRPLICTRKINIVSYAASKGLEYLTDPTNSSLSHGKRNKVRSLLIPHVEYLLPGIWKNVKNRIKEGINKQQ